MTGDMFIDAGHAPTERKDYFKLLRWLLTISTLHDAYFMSGDLQNHHWNNYYDEFDVPLGWPKGGAHMLGSGAWLRCFDNGASITNPTSATVTVTAAELQAYPECAGTYYRFKGNQDPVWNNGQLFDSVTLTVSTPPVCINDSGGSCSPTTQYIGDGILLVKQPNVTVVSDVIVDNSYASTNAGSKSATMSGFSRETSSQLNNRAWSTTIDYAKDERYYHSYYAAAGTGTATAVFKPTINVSGQYRVYEWHGWHGSSAAQYNEATNAPLTITHAGGTYVGTVDQNTNYGQWNLVGTFNFTAGGNWNATITNNANGYVLADAFKWEYVGP
jgi:hypothetical protein